VGTALPISGLTEWQGLIDHPRLTTGQTVLIHGAAGGVGSIAVQLAREVGALVIGTGPAPDRETALGLGVSTFLDLQADKLEDAGEVDVVFDVIGGEILDRSSALVRAGGTLVTIARMPTVQRGGGIVGDLRSPGPRRSRTKSGSGERPEQLRRPNRSYRLVVGRLPLLVVLQPDERPEPTLSDQLAPRGRPRFGCRCCTLRVNGDR
jgi:NADPH:quinone reductase-like Zn-dependent oxidoreductase